MMAENEEDLAEFNRLLYVAATRAADYLILSAGVEEPGKAAGPWMELLARRFDLMTAKTRERGEGRGERKQNEGERFSPVQSMPAAVPRHLRQGNHRRAGDPVEARRSSPAARPDEDRGEGPADGRRRLRAGGRDTWRRCLPTRPRGGNILFRV